MEEGDGTGGVGQRGGLCGVDFAHETATTKLPQHHHLARSLARFSHSAFFRLSSSVSSKCGASGGCGYFLHLCTEYPAADWKLGRNLHYYRRAHCPSPREAKLLRIEAIKFDKLPIVPI